MTKSTVISKLTVGGVFATADEFDLGVRRVNQDSGKLVVLARRNTKTIHHICLLQSRERARVSGLNKGRKKCDRIKPKSVCSGCYIAR